MIKIKQEDLLELEIRIENISCHLNPNIIKENKYVSIRAMIEETERLKKSLIMLDKTESIDIGKIYI